MKTFKILHSLLLAGLFFITSSSKNDNSAAIPEEQIGVGVLSSGTVPVITSRSMETNIAFELH